MTTGSTLYLLMCLATFGLFSVVLGYYSWQESRPDRKAVSAPARQAEPHDTLAA